eukprot:30649_1
MMYESSGLEYDKATSAKWGWVASQVAAAAVAITIFTSFGRRSAGFNGQLTVLLATLVAHSSAGVWLMLAAKDPDRPKQILYIASNAMFLPFVISFGFYHLVLSAFVWIYALLLGGFTFLFYRSLGDDDLDTHTPINESAAPYQSGV